MPIAHTIQRPAILALGLLLCGAVMIPRPLAADPAQRNVLEIVDTGHENAVEIVQRENAGHVARVGISGSRNGAASDGYAPRITGRMGSASLVAGRIEQTGLRQSLALDVSGKGNLFGISQTGSGNAITGRMTGASNQAFVAQAGAENRVSFSQSGQRNTIAIRQSM